MTAKAARVRVGYSDANVDSKAKSKPPDVSDKFQFICQKQKGKPRLPFPYANLAVFSRELFHLHGQSIVLTPVH